MLSQQIFSVLESKQADGPVSFSAFFRGKAWKKKEEAD
jgi:hypothetical protein